MSNEPGQHNHKSGQSERLSSRHQDPSRGSNDFNRKFEKYRSRQNDGRDSRESANSDTENDRSVSSAGYERDYDRGMTSPDSQRSRSVDGYRSNESESRNLDRNSSRDSDYNDQGGSRGGYDQEFQPSDRFTHQSQYMNNGRDRGSATDYEDSRNYAGPRYSRDYEDRRDTSNRGSRRTLNKWEGGRYSQEADMEMSGSNDRWNPAYDLSESENEYTMSWDVPGLQKDQFKMSLAGNRLSVTGERARGEGSSRSTGSRYGKFSRDFTLPEGIDPEGIDAQYQDGILSLKMPKAESSKSRQLSIRGLEGSSAEQSASGKSGAQKNQNMNQSSNTGANQPKPH